MSDLTGIFDWARSDLSGIFDWETSDLTGDLPGTVPLRRQSVVRPLSSSSFFFSICIEQRGCFQMMG